MDTVIFCPTEEMLPTAEELSRLHVAPILIGDNERTKDLIFDRGTPRPISIPTEHSIKFSHSPVKVNQLIGIDYKNEFLVFDDDVKISLFLYIVGEPNGHRILDVKKTNRHSVHFGLNFGMPGDCAVCVWYKDKIIHTFDFVVNDDDA